MKFFQWIRHRFQTVLIFLLGLSTVVVILRIHQILHSKKQLPSDRELSRSDSWTPLGGSWSVSSHEIQNSSEERGAKLMIRSGSWKNYQVQADLQLTEPYGEAGLIIRSNREEEGVDAYHGYFAGVRSMDRSFEFGRADYGWHSFIHQVLPENTNLDGWIHLRLIAVFCNFGIQITFADGTSHSVRIRDPDCIESGRFGLRSYLTSAGWKNIRVSLADERDLDMMPDAGLSGENTTDLIVAEPLNPVSRDRYAQSILAEARKRAVLPGVYPILSFLMWPGEYPDVTIQGVIISTPPLAAIQDDSGALIIPNIDSHMKLKLGDVVEAHGTVISQRYRSRLEDAKIRILWSDVPIPPLAVTADQLNSGTYRGRTVEVEGTLVAASSHPNQNELILQDGDYTFRALGTEDLQFDPKTLAIGSRLRLRGIATSLYEFTHGIYPFTIVTDRIKVVSSPPWWSARHVIELILGCITLFACIQFILHRLQRWHMRSVLQEREQLAFEMHDTLAQSFTGIAYQLEAASLERRGAYWTQEHIQNALKMVHMSHREASQTIAALRPQYRDTASLLEALKESAERLSNGSGLRIETMFTGKSAELPLEVTDSFFRIGQEAISNAIQHSGGKTLALSLRISRREAQMKIEDDGRGFLEAHIQNGLGITGMRTRASKIKAELVIDAVQGQGTTVTVTAPLGVTQGGLYRLRAMLMGKLIGMSK